jgi:Domain of unknown function (DUF6851)/Secretion system C-terminal sorting domain
VRILLFSILIGTSSIASAQHSVARDWNEVLLDAIRKDLARPTVHARNLFHTAVAMYDAWAAYDQTASTYFFEKTPDILVGLTTPAAVKAAREEAVSYAAYRLLKHRFSFSPGAQFSLGRCDSLMVTLGYDTSFTAVDYSTGNPAAVGNFIAQHMIEVGLHDHSNEEHDYGNLYYTPVNPPLDTQVPGDTTIIDPNRWQPLTLGRYIDQSGNVLPVRTPSFVGAEWGQVTPFALTPADRGIHQRDGYDYWVYHDPGPPPAIDTLNPASELSEAYKWAFTLVAVWSSHLDATDTVQWDISPASIGNVQDLPQTLSGLMSFYNMLEGGDPGTGRPLNPRTGMAYQPQIVPRGDYARVLAEFWADGPNSETPPGHWFTILNYVSDHPLFQKRFRGQGPVLDDLEWDVKAYFALGGAVHDAAVAAWGIKGWYDFVRPISAIRWMAEKGQCSNATLPGYSPSGIHLIPGYIDVVQAGDSLAGPNNENVGKIKLRAWRAHAYIVNPVTDVAGVGWVLAENWWPYQRPTFVTPPFAGYISGHSTFSRASAEVMTLLTGDEYFPGGMGEFFAPKNQYLVFEDGPSVDVTLQWATYRDASDQCSLSRIWGGIHPPVDDMPGRLIGRTIGINAFTLAEKYFLGEVTSVRGQSDDSRGAYAFPNPVNRGSKLLVRLNSSASPVSITLYNVLGQQVYAGQVSAAAARPQALAIDTQRLATGFYVLRISGSRVQRVQKILIVK